MAKKDCVICGKPGYSYFPFCYEHLQAKNAGKIVKCPDCDEWYIKADGCKCKRDAPKTDGENKCKICGKPCGKYQLCFDCYRTQNSKIENQPTTKKEVEYTRKAIVKELGIEDTDIRKKWEAMHRCNDGHYVRSYSETLIDNWLYDNHIVHAYEKSVYLKKNPDELIISDFYIPEGKVYIEFWGLNTDKYTSRKDEKITLYQNNDINLINLEEDDIKRLDDVMPRLLYKYIKD